MHRAIFVHDAHCTTDPSCKVDCTTNPNSPSCPTTTPCIPGAIGISCPSVDCTKTPDDPSCPPPVHIDCPEKVGFSLRAIEIDWRSKISIHTTPGLS